MDGVWMPVYDPAFAADPYPFYRRLQEQGGIGWVRMATGVDAWVVTDHALARSLLNDPRLSKDSRHAGPRWHRAQPQRRGGTSTPLFRHLLTTDPPDHTRLRALVSRHFTVRRVQELAPRVQAVTDGLIDAVLPRGRADLVDDIAFVLPVVVICELLGVPHADRDDFRRWSTVLVAAGEHEQDQIPIAADRMRAYLGELAAHKRRSPDDGLYSALVAAHDTGDGLDADELVSMGFLLLVAGHETTVNLIGNGMRALLADPAQLAALRADPRLVPGAVEECLRFDGPLEMATPRFATAPIDVRDVRVEAGDTVFVALGAAGRDPARYPRPDVFDVTRDATGHLAFGYGLHYCLGAPLARLEGRIAISALVERLPGLRLAVPPDELRHRPGLIMRGLEHLPVAWDAPAPAPAPAPASAAAAAAEQVAPRGHRDLRGRVDAGFDGVAEAFAGGFARGEECGAALCVVHRGRVVVDLWGGPADRGSGRPWGPDTLVPLTSVTKSLLAVLALVAIGRGALEPTAPVRALWPELAVGGATVADVLAHRAGLPAFARPITLQDQVDRDPVLRMLESQRPEWEPGTAHGYHANTFGYLVTEILRRATGTTEGALVGEVVREPLGCDVHIGLDPADIGRVAAMVPPEGELAHVDPALARYAEGMADPTSLTHRATFGSTAMTFADMNDPRYYTAERPSGGYATARGLARALAALTGPADGPRLVGPDLVDLARTERSAGADLVFGFPTRWGLGLLLPGGPLWPEPVGGAAGAAFGHIGSSGAMAVVDPERELALAYLPNKIKNVLECTDRRARRLVLATYAALEAIAP